MLNIFGGMAAPAPTFIARLQTSVVPERNSNATGASFTRATTKTFVDWEGVVRTALSGEVAFQGARRVRNLWGRSEDASNAEWQKFNATASYTAGDSPTGTAGFSQISAPSGIPHGIYRDITVSPNTPHRVSFWARKPSGSTATQICVTVNNTAAWGSGIGGTDGIAITSSWQRFSFLVQITSGTALRILIGSQIEGGGYNSNAGDKLDVTGMMLEDVTGQSNQNPSEYVSVSVLSSPFHGAMVDGVKYFSTENGNTVASNVVTEATGPAIPKTGRGIARLSGASGTYFSTPDSAAADITGDIDIRVHVALADWVTGAGAQVLISKVNAANQYAYNLYINGTGEPRFTFSQDGSTQITAIASASPSVSDGQALWIRVTRASSSGDTIFYTSPDGGSWTQLGTTRSTTAGAIANTTSGLEVGSQLLGTSALLNGSIFRAQIYNGINGTLAVDFDPSRWTTGTTFTGGTGETWTLNGGAKVTKVERGYLAEQASTNLLTRSQEVDNAAWDKVSTTATANTALAPDGTTTMETVGNQAIGAGTYHYIRQSPSLTQNTTYALSAFVKPKTGSGIVWLLGNDSGDIFCYFNVSTGVVTQSTGFVSASIQQVSGGAYRISAVFTNTAATGVQEVGLGLSQVTGTPNWDSTGLANSQEVYVWGLQLEVLSFATSYIPTTSATVTRNADVLTYPSAGNVVALNPHTIYAEAAINGVVPGNQQLVGSDVNYNLYFVLQTGVPRVAYFNNNSDTFATITRTTPQMQVATKYAARMDGTNIDVFAAGTKGTSAGKGTQVAEITTIHIGAHMAAQSLNGIIREVKLWGQALPDHVLRAETSPR